MSAVVEYRQRAAEFRHNADTSRQPLTRLMHKKAAQRWDAYAEEHDGSMPGRIGLVRQQRAYCV